VASADRCCIFHRSCSHVLRAGWRGGIVSAGQWHGVCARVVHELREDEYACDGAAEGKSCCASRVGLDAFINMVSAVY